MGQEKSGGRTRRIVLVSFAIGVALILVGVTAFSYAYEPQHIDPYTPGNQDYTYGNVTYLTTTNNNTETISAGSDGGTLHLEFSSLLVLQAGKTGANLSKGLIYGALYNLFSADMTISNETLGTPLTSLTFFAEDYSLASNNSSLVFYTSAANYYPNGGVLVNGREITPSSGIYFSVSVLSFELVHLRGPFKFWFNTTVVPVEELGPYYFEGTPVHMSVTWTDYF